MPLDSAPPPGTRVSVYGRPARVAAPPSSRRPPQPSVWVDYDEPHEIDPLAGPGDDHRSAHPSVPIQGTWVYLSEPTLYLLPLNDDKQPALACTLTGSAAQFEDLRTTLRIARVRLTDPPVGPSRQRAMASLDRFLTQLATLQSVTAADA